MTSVVYTQQITIGQQSFAPLINDASSSIREGQNISVLCPPKQNLPFRVDYMQSSVVDTKQNTLLQLTLVVGKHPNTNTTSTIEVDNNSMHRQASNVETLQLSHSPPPRTVSEDTTDVWSRDTARSRRGLGQPDTNFFNTLLLTKLRVSQTVWREGDEAIISSSATGPASVRAPHPTNTTNTTLTTEVDNKQHQGEALRAHSETKQVDCITWGRENVLGLKGTACGEKYLAESICWATRIGTGLGNEKELLTLWEAGENKSATEEERSAKKRGERRSLSEDGLESLANKKHKQDGGVA